VFAFHEIHVMFWGADWWLLLWQQDEQQPHKTAASEVQRLLLAMTVNVLSWAINCAGHGSCLMWGEETHHSCQQIFFTLHQFDKACTQSPVVHLKSLRLLWSEHDSFGGQVCIMWLVALIDMSQAMQITVCMQKPISMLRIAKVVWGKFAVGTTCEHDYLAARQNKRIRDLVIYHYHFPLELLDMWLETSSILLAHSTNDFFCILAIPAMSW